MSADVQPLGQQIATRHSSLRNPSASHQKIYQLALVFVDIVMLSSAFCIAYWLRFSAGVTVAPHVIPSPGRYISLICILVPLWIFLFAIMNLYDAHLLLGGTREFSRALNACTCGMMLVVLVSFLDAHFVISRAWLVMSWVFSGIFICSGRLLLRNIAYYMQSHGYLVSRALIIGTNEEAKTLVRQLRVSDYSGSEILGFIQTDSEQDETQLEKLPIMGRLDNLHEVIRREEVTEVIACSSALNRSQLLRVLHELSSVPEVELHLSSGLYEAVTTSMHVIEKGSIPFMSPDRWRLNLAELSLKRLTDLLALFFALPIILSLSSIIALIIKLDSPGPILVKKRALGVGGTRFDAYKFRTESVTRRYDEKQLFHRTTTKRLTRAGRWLQRTGLDELPQLINVLLGQMSLVGPRLISPLESEVYGIYSADLLSVKPGLTGLWQVSGRTNVMYHERVRLDMYYIRNYSIWLDMQILLFQTLPVTLKGL